MNIINELYEIDDIILSCIDEETGEIIDDKSLDSIEMDRREKISQVVHIIQNCEARVKMIKDEEDKLKSKRESAKKQSEYWRNALQQYLGGEKISEPTYKVYYRNVSSVEITDGTKLEDRFLRFRDPEPDKKAITAAIKAGEEVDGATMITRSAMIIG